MPARGKRRGSKKRSTWDWYLVALVALAVVVLGSFLWYLISARTGPPEALPDFGSRLRELAAARGASSADVIADEPIRKVEETFVRTWRIGLPNDAAQRALEEDIVAEAARWRASITAGPATEGDTRRMRLDLEGEAFDIHLSVTRRQQVVLRAPTLTPRVRPTATLRPQPSREARGRLAILLDDAGQSKELLALAERLPSEIGVSILPFLPHSAEVATEMHRAGHEVWVHLPMEPQGYPDSDPGPGAILVSMSDAEIRTAVHAALNNVPHAIGVNNHMGSKATADLRTMTWVMQELKARGMAFIDSRTTRATVAEQAARAQGVPAGRRQVFLDNERTRTAVRKQLGEAVYRARLDGEAIAIGHLAEVTIEVLGQELPAITARGADLVPPSALTR